MRKEKVPSKKVKKNSEIIKAKIFQNGRSQAVRLPKEFRFDGTEIGVGRVGNSVILFPLNDPWALFFEGARELSETDLPDIEREQVQTRRSFEK